MIGVGMPEIEDLKSLYKGEWLAIEVTMEDASGPVEGRLIYHSTSREDVWRKIKGDRRRIYVTYAGPLIEEGYAVAFYAY